MPHAETPTRPDSHSTPTDASVIDDVEDLVRMPIVQRMLGGCSRASVWRYVAAGKLPAPIHLGQHALWSRAELRRHLAALFAARRRA